MAHAQFHVVPDDGVWRVEENGQELSTHQTQQEAIDDARHRAQTVRPSQVIIHGRDGRIQDESTYGDDPFPPRG
ncbi:DUF2188 domain-containing protein [Microlunatus soli]|uniref:DUF2188 domain-containing protein n=1 Tax=Microlunatus soli TaxID=630515 RepID=A0A1H1N8B1_9ACTN|nr:DUF2188 domain-containing protein [Microlunatus soli]SDR95263.1 hypothetical protein SAMN04489812_0422 [Microlunatus soli]